MTKQEIKKEKLEKLIKIRFLPRDLIFGFVIYYASLHVGFAFLDLLGLNEAKHYTDFVVTAFLGFFLFGPKLRKTYYKNRILALQKSKKFINKN